MLENDEVYPNIVDFLESKLTEILKKKDIAIQNEYFKIANELQEFQILLQEQLAQASHWIKGKQEELNRIVREENVAQILELVTSIPVTKVTKNESKKLLKMEEVLHNRVIGQHEAVTAISRSLRRSRVGLKNPNRPIASFMFCGPTGVGKTELVKVLATYFFGSSKSLIIFDMSEYMERHAISKLIGAAPGYAGYGEGGLLTEAISKKPYSVILFDEIEKAHPDIFNLMLQIFEEGQLTDSKGRKINFRNTLLILTSNVGSIQIAKINKNFYFQQDKNKINLFLPSNHIKELVNKELKKRFRPEFINRIDEIIVFKALRKDEIGEIAEIMLQDILKQLIGQGITFKVTNRFKIYLIDQGYKPTSGARALRRAITSLVLDNLSEEMISEKLKIGDIAVLDIGIDNEVKILTANNL